MVIDTSALVAILFAEPEADRFAEAIADDPSRLISAASLLEASIVLESERGEPIASPTLSAEPREKPFYSRASISPGPTSPPSCSFGGV